VRKKRGRHHEYHQIQKRGRPSLGKGCIGSPIKKQPQGAQKQILSVTAWDISKTDISLMCAFPSSQAKEGSRAPCRDRYLIIIKRETKGASSARKKLLKIHEKEHYAQEAMQNVSLLGQLLSCLLWEPEKIFQGAGKQRKVASI